MADPLSITVSALAVITAAVHSTKSLYDAVSSYRGRDKTLGRLQDELQGLAKILDSLKQVDVFEASMLETLCGPIDRCGKVCHEFERSMESFWRESKTGIRDWSKMEFMRGDINEFIDIISGYKSTFCVGLGTINLHTANVSQKVLKQYNEMIQDTAYNLEMHLQRTDEKMERFKIDRTSTSGSSVSLSDELEVTKQCLRVCEDAGHYIESLLSREFFSFRGPAGMRLHQAPYIASELFVGRGNELDDIAKALYPDHRAQKQ